MKIPDCIMELEKNGLINFVEEADASFIYVLDGDAFPMIEVYVYRPRAEREPPTRIGNNEVRIAADKNDKETTQYNLYLGDAVGAASFIRRLVAINDFD